MKMTRSHFEALATMCANILNRLDNMTEYDYEMIIGQFIALGNKSNPNFDGARFVKWVNEQVI